MTSADPAERRPRRPPETDASPGSAFTVEEVTTAAACEEFIACTSDPDGVARVPPLAADIRAWFRGDHPHVDELTLLLVRDRRGAVVGRCTAHRSAEADRRLRPHLAPGTSGPLLLFGAVAAAGEPELRALLDALEDRAMGLGAAAVVGPVSLLPNQTGGTVIGGFEQPGFFDAADNGPTLPRVLEEAGYRRWYPAATWEVDVAEAPAARRRRPTERELAAAGMRRVRVSRLRMRGRRGLVERIRTATNASFASLDYYTPVSRRQMARQTAGLELLTDPRLIVALEDRRADRGDRLAAFALVVPDPAEVLRAGGGELGPAQLPALLGRRRREAVLIIQAVAPEHQGRGLLTLVSRELFAALHAGGYRRLRVTFIGEENPASAAVFARAGGRRMHQVCFHVRRMPDDPADRRPAAERPVPSVTRVRAWCDTAARAPSAHNTQPWDPEPLAEADGGCRRLRLRVAAGRSLPVGDPTGRDLLLALGAWVESLDVAAGADGWSAEVAAVHDDGAPDGAGRPGCGGRAGVVVDLTWRRRDAPSRATVDDVRTRRVHRGRLHPPGPDGTDRTAPALPEGFMVVDAAHAARLERRAARHPVSSPALVAELLDWLRLDPGDPRWDQDGLSAECLRLPRAAHGLGRLLRSPAGPALRSALVRLVGRLSPPLSAGGTGTGVVMHGPGDDAAQLLAAGRRLQRCWLDLHRRGLAVAPASQVVDHPAAAAELASLLDSAGPAGPTGGAATTPLAWFRVGVPDDVPPRSARRGDRSRSAGRA